MNEALANNNGSLHKELIVEYILSKKTNSNKKKVLAGMYAAGGYLNKINGVWSLPV